ncbi:beta-lactamase family protein [Muricauda sp. CAU 1633]|uniref:serine hydrolase domain-containing protein n=1 Tax=Allomuricauda sp. CAU 1633 TaxID=2816036 RepID=UPI001A8F5D4B|nr:serine hydrolase domain-containing protein [Muricauda sp. CAU 1633]MBO0322733.1 beta-lactamase family protein [Muricauda sp. CAU 1633]
MSPLFAHIKQLFSNSPRTKLEEGLRGLEKADAIFHNLVAEGQVPGMAVTVLKKGQIVLQKGYGYADVERKVPVDAKQTIFRIASISKCITGLTLGKMLEDGILDLDSSFYDYVPYYSKKKYDFTLRQLASHTAGIRGYRGKEYALDQPYSIKDSVEVFKDSPLVFEPGKGYLYNSFDFVLLSLAMQEASGMPFEDYVAENVLQPLGMGYTFSPCQVERSRDLLQQKKLRLAQFYTKTSLCFKKALPVNNSYKLAGGGFLSTSRDVALLGEAILEQKLLKKETYDQLLTSQMINGKSVFYGLGFQVSQDAKGRSFVGHVGNSVGTYTNFFVYPKEELVISILINCTDPKVQEKLDGAIDALFRL